MARAPFETAETVRVSEAPVTLVAGVSCVGVRDGAERDKCGSRGTSDAAEMFGAGVGGMQWQMGVGLFRRKLAKATHRKITALGLLTRSLTRTNAPWQHAQILPCKVMSIMPYV